MVVAIHHSRGHDRRLQLCLPGQYCVGVDPDRYLDVISRESDRLATAADGGIAREVPSCPGWRLSDLIVHLGVIQRWAAQMVRSGASEPIRDRDQRFGVDPNDPALLDWFRLGAAKLVTTLRDCPLEAPVWSWTQDTTSRFWRRRQAHEVTIHRWDAEAAAGDPSEIEHDLAADGIDEWLHAFALARSRPHSTREGRGENFQFRCTDGAEEWNITFEGKGMRLHPKCADPDLAVSGIANDLLLFFWGRRPGTDLEVSGDTTLLDSWRELLPPV